MDMSPVHKVWPEPSCKAQWKHRFFNPVVSLVKGGKKTRQTEKEVGRQHQGMDMPEVRQVQEGSGEQGKMEKTGCKIICGAPMTFVVKG